MAYTRNSSSPFGFQLMWWWPGSSSVVTFLLVALLAASHATKAKDIITENLVSGSTGHENFRQLQLEQGDKADGSILVRSCQYLDSFTDPRLVCDVGASFSSSTSSVDVDVALNCSSSSSTFTFREVADQCQCNTMFADPSTGQTKECPCAACPDGFGENSIFVDCGDSGPLIDSCSLIDCEYTCNGPNVTAILTPTPTASPTTSPSSPQGEDNTSGSTPNGGNRIERGSGAHQGVLCFVLVSVAISVQMVLQ